MFERFEYIVEKYGLLAGYLFLKVETETLLTDDIKLASKADEKAWGYDLVKIVAGSPVLPRNIKDLMDLAKRWS